MDPNQRGREDEWRRQQSAEDAYRHRRDYNQGWRWVSGIMSPTTAEACKAAISRIIVEDRDSGVRQASRPRQNTSRRPSSVVSSSSMG